MLEEVYTSENQLFMLNKPETNLTFLGRGDNFIEKTWKKNFGVRLKKLLLGFSCLHKFCIQ